MNDSAKKDALHKLAKFIKDSDKDNAIYWLGRCEALGYLPANDYVATCAWKCDNLSYKRKLDAIRYIHLLMEA